MFLIKFNEKYEVCCHGNICASTLPTSSFKARYVILKAYKKTVELPSQMIKLIQSISSKFAEFSLFTVVCHQQIYQLLAIYSRLSPANLPNICYLRSTVTSKFTQYLLLTVDCHQPLRLYIRVKCSMRYYAVIDFCWGLHEGLFNSKLHINRREAEVSMKCFVFNSTACSPKQKSTIVILFKKYISVETSIMKRYLRQILVDVTCTSQTMRHYDVAS